MLVDAKVRDEVLTVATEVPMALVFVGKTSEASTHDTGPNDSEKKILVMKIMAIPARCADVFVFGCPLTSGGKQATMAVRTEYVQTNAPAPNMSGFLRPTVSRIRVMKLFENECRHRGEDKGNDGTHKKFVIGPTAP